jgi:hypothetical protein
MKPGEVDVKTHSSVDAYGRLMITLSGEIHGTIILPGDLSLLLARQIVEISERHDATPAPAPASPPPAENP